MRKLLLSLMVCLTPACVTASEISSFDVGTYALTKSDGQPIGMEMRLSRFQGKWMMEGKDAESTAPWKNISCDSGCEYRVTSAAERATYLAAFGAETQGQFDLWCIQNMANAFCRITNKNDSSKGGYVLVALVTGRPTPISLKRLTRPVKPAETSR
jgi:hypothetical protein